MTREALSRMLKDTDGAMLVWFAIALPAVLVAASLAIDMSYSYFTRAKLQTTASSAALAGATQLPPPDEVLDAGQEATMKGLVREEARIYAEEQNHGLGLQGNYLDEANDVKIGNWNEATDTFTPDPSDQVAMPYNAVQVTTRRTSDGGNELNLLVATAIGEVDVNTPAIATLNGGDIVGDVCLLVLDPTESSALLLNGSDTIESENCGICVNSAHPSAAISAQSGSHDVDLDISSGGESGFTHVHGGFTGGSGFKPPIEKGKPVCEDPFAYEIGDPDRPAFMDRFGSDSCADDVGFSTIGGKDVFPAGVHCANKNNGDLQPQGSNDAVFEAGIHHFIGDDPGDPMKFKIASNAEISSEAPGVTFLLSNTELDWGGNKPISLTANSVDGEGFLFYQNPADAAENVQHKFHGNVDAGLFGIQYFGHQNLLYDGNVGTVDTSPGGCTVLVAERVRYNGGGNSKHRFDASGCSDQDPPVARNELFYRLVN